MKKKKLSIFIVPGNYEEKKGLFMKKVLSYRYTVFSSVFIGL